MLPTSLPLRKAPAEIAQRIAPSQVEIDCYDHDQLTLGTTLKPGQGPVVMHGGTLTAPTLLSACLAEIRKSAFVASEYPVIISLANHCSPEGQAEIAEMLEATFGRELYIPPTVPENLTAFPSPEQLKRKVVLRDRTLPPRDDDAATEGESVSSKHGTSRTGESGSRRRSVRRMGRAFLPPPAAAAASLVPSPLLRTLPRTALIRASPRVKNALSHIKPRDFT